MRFKLDVAVALVRGLGGETERIGDLRPARPAARAPGDEDVLAGVQIAELGA